MRRLNTRRPKRAAQRHHDRAMTEVTRLVRLSPSMWSATVTYSHGLSEWSERVRFVVESATESALTVVITDGDFPKDRARRVHLDAHVDFAQFIHDYLIAGRW